MDALLYLLALCCTVATATHVVDVWHRIGERRRVRQLRARTAKLVEEVSRLRGELVAAKYGLRVVSPGDPLMRECGLLDGARAPGRLRGPQKGA